eukprot:Em0015g459a
MCKSCAKRSELETETPVSVKENIVQQFDQVVAHGGHDIRVGVTNRSIDDTCHGNVDGRNEACPNVTESRVHASSSSLVDIEKEQIRAANPTIVGDSKLGVDGDEMKDEDSLGECRTWHLKNSMMQTALLIVSRIATLPTVTLYVISLQKTWLHYSQIVLSLSG